MPYKIIHFKKDCIGCGACAAVAPDYWQMEEDGLAHLKNSKQIDENRWELDIPTEEAKAINQEAVDVCPVNVIKIEKK